MAHLGTLSHYHFQGDVDDVRGATVYGRDEEKLGTIDDVIFEHDTGNIRSVVIDTGGWLSSRKFTVPAERIDVRDDNELFVDLSREQVERFPRYEENLHQDPDRWRDYEDRYRESYSETGGVLHKEGGVNIITPEADEMPAVSGDIHGDFTPDRMAGKFTDTAPSSSKIRMRPSGTAARAEDTKTPGTFQNTETAHWQDPDSSLRQDNLGEVSNRDLSTADRDFSTSDLAGSDVSPRDISARDLNERNRYVIGEDTGRNISNADLTEDNSAYGDIDRTAVPNTRSSDPSSYREKFDGVEDDLDRPYPVQQGRKERWRAFEENLRRNRVDITASCHSCAPAKDKAA